MTTNFYHLSLIPHKAQQKNPWESFPFHIKEFPRQQRHGVFPLPATQHWAIAAAKNCPHNISLKKSKNEMFGSPK